MAPHLTNKFIIHPNGSDNYVEITCDINIKETTYEVSYKYRFSEKIDTVEKEISILKILELYDNDAMDPYEGDIIYKNSLSEHLIKYLCMSDEDLSKVSGNVHYENYRLSIIKSIQLLWD
tara:strand:- start:208 stop:567 length:360 start_codon:yes stop_codon:yes gene_type:complete